MKIKLRRLFAGVLTATMVLGMTMQASAFTYPNSYWPLHDAWSAAVASQNVDQTISIGKQTYDLLMGQFGLCADVCYNLEVKCDQVAWCYEMKGDLTNAILWRQRQLQMAQWLNDNERSYQDTILNVTAQLQHLQRQMEVYALVDDPADVPYTGTTGEPVSGVYYGTVPNGTQVNDSAHLVYVNFMDGYSLPYWVDYYADGDASLANDLKNGGVVELAWNFTESNSGLDTVLSSSADSYIQEGVDYLGQQNCTFLLRLGAEMNCWTSLPDPQKFIQAYQKIAKVARQYDNIALVFSPNDVSNRTVDYETYYPGDAYVDWIGCSSYKSNPTGNGSSYAYGNKNYSNDAYYCTGIYGNDPLVVLQDLNALAEKHDKPMMISECGFGYYNNSTGADQTAFATQQLTKFYSYLPMVYPRVKAIFFFDVDLSSSTYRYSLGGNSSVYNAYQQAVTSSAFIQDGENSAQGYTRLSTVNEKMDTLKLYTYAIFPGSGSATCQYYVDGALKYTATAEPFAYNLPVSSLTPGTHTIKVVATRAPFSKTVERTIFVDAQGNVTGSGATGMDLSSADNWAMGHILSAKNNGLLTARTSSGFRSNVTRLQFAELAVNLVERATGETLSTGSQSFTDTSDPVALKAAAAGITSGTGDGSTFSPNSPITRQEISVMLNQVIRLVDEAKGTDTLTSKDDQLGSQFTDKGEVASWAAKSMALLTNNGLMSGQSGGRLAPKSNTTVQEAIVLILAMYNKF